MKVLVTGAAGFIGSTLCESLLQDGHQVVGVDSFTDYYGGGLKRRNLSSCVASSHFNLIQDDINRVDLGGVLDGVSTVFHLAGSPGVRSSWGDRFAEYTDNNVRATQRLLEACLSNNPGVRFVYASSSSVYGNSPSFPCVEDQPLHPRSPYGVTKLAGEHLVSLYGENFALPTVSLRFFTVYGPRQRPDMAFQRFLSSAHLGEEIVVYGTGKQIRDFTFVADIVSGLRRASEASVKPGAVFNLSGGSSVSVNDALDIISSLAGGRLRVRHEDVVAGDVFRTGGSSRAASQELGWTAKVGLEEGLRKQWEAVSAARL
ncbi:NAD-dependent epimerase/dehydratase family protein [Terrabacter sp. NPDC080008]|uniref:NAD-dependent epimerase/dehydratase family protein n=1 Tax=Terrabacter sp. NPDC080008 TaxID=3155176 RepID=UPI00345046AF